MAPAPLPWQILRSFEPLGFSYNVLRVVHGENGYCDVILLGDEAGKLHLLPAGSSGEIQNVLETKGASIQALCSFPITKLSLDDIVTGDALGIVTLFSNKELLSRQTLPHPITALIVSSDNGGVATIFVGDQCGTVTTLVGMDLAVSTSFILPSLQNQSLRYDKKIQFLETFQFFCPENKQISHYILVGDGSPYLYVYSTGVVLVRAISLPSNPLSISKGSFTCDHNEIIVSCEDGCLYIIKHLQESVFYASVGYPGSLLLTVQSNMLTYDLLACAGHWNGVKLLYEGKEKYEYVSDSWVISMDKIAAPNVPCICIGEENGSIHLLSLPM